VYGVSAEGAQGEWSDEFLGPRGHHHSNFCAGFDQLTNE